MANYCEYKVIVKGKKNACFAYFGSMSALDYKSVVETSGTDEEFIMRFEGNCKWAVDAYSEPWTGECPVALPDSYEEAFELAEEKYWYKTVQDRSKMFEVEVFCNSADVEDYDPEDGPYEIFEHYFCGEERGGECPDELRITGDFEMDEDEEDWFLQLREVELPLTVSLEGTAYEGRAERIEHISEGEELILKADYENPYYSPVAIEVFNMNNESLGYVADPGIPSLSAIAEVLDRAVPYVLSVTPLSKRSKRAKYPLMDIILEEM